MSWFMSVSCRCIAMGDWDVYNYDWLSELTVVRINHLWFMTCNKSFYLLKIIKRGCNNDCFLKHIYIYIYIFLVRHVLDNLTGGKLILLWLARRVSLYMKKNKNKSSITGKI